MMKRLVLATLALFVFLHGNLHAQTVAQDQGTISSVYIDELGRVAIRLRLGFTNNPGTCPTANGWAGNDQMASTIKALLLMAKSSDLGVVITTQGCERGGAWFKIVDAYLN